MEKKNMQYSIWSKVGFTILNLLSLITFIVGLIGVCLHESIEGKRDFWFFVDDMHTNVYALKGYSFNTISFIVKALMNYGYLLFVISGILFIATMIIICLLGGHRDDTDEIRLRFIDRIPYGLLIFILIGIIGCCLAFFVDTYFYVQSLSFIITFGGLFFLMLYASCYIGVLSTVVRFKTKEFMHYTAVGMIWNWLKNHKIFNSLEGIKDNWKERNSLVKRFNIGLFALTFFELIVISAIDPNGNIVLVWVFYKIVSIPVLEWVVIQLGKIFDGMEKIANGNLEEPILENHMYYDFKKAAGNLNRIKDGVQISIDDKVRSEKLKTELITNVSHDIKTPLTSIINYVDLLGKEYEKDEPSFDTEKEYVAILSKQSSRLKKLIEDLIEASKATTGNIKMDMNDVDVSIILNQAAAEFDDRLEKAGLSLVMPENHSNIMAKADGRHLWRIFDNLLSNITKYSMANTRVYISAEDTGNKVRITFKNISREPLNISADELMERFTRGDSSRNTEGSGLGLSIASSLTNLMGGRMELSVDGDLFKAIVELEKA
ncbi:MAG: sensor histidine kinase [Lachnospiraceae bacterium]|nr:sensor histidine kinase [Lachnospiraceae bacterium]